MSEVKVLTIKESAEKISKALGMEFKERKIMYLIRTQKIKAQKVGWIWVISEDEVNRLIKEYKG